MAGVIECFRIHNVTTRVDVDFECHHSEINSSLVCLLWKGAIPLAAFGKSWGA